MKGVIGIIVMFAMFLLSIGCFVQPTLAGDATTKQPQQADDYMTEGPTGCYEFGYQRPGPADIKGNRIMIPVSIPLDKDVLIINVSKQLTLDKQSVARAPKDVASVCNDFGKSIYEKLIKNPEVSGVVIAPRQIAITKIIYPVPWEKLQPQVLQIIQDILCKK
jgi:hypothetical protein